MAKNDRMQLYTNILLNVNLVHLVIVTMEHSKANTESTSIKFHCMHHQRNGKKRQDAIVYKYMTKCEFSTFSDCYNGTFKSQY